MITIKADRPALQIERDGQTTKWEYDVVTLKLEIESLRETHKETAEFLQAFAKRLESHGLPGAGVDLAMRIESLVRVQFAQLSKSILTQLAEMKD
jgi:hypothetical protein